MANCDIGKVVTLNQNPAPQRAGFGDGSPQGGHLRLLGSGAHGLIHTQPEMVGQYLAAGPQFNLAGFFSFRL